MGRQELCLTFIPERDDPGAVERRLRAVLDAGFADCPVVLDGTYASDREDLREHVASYGEAVEGAEPGAFGFYRVDRDGDRVLVHGTAHDYNVSEAVREALLSCHPADGRVVAVYTESEADTGWGWLYRWDGDRYREVDAVDEHGNPAYGRRVQAYFEREHDLTVRRRRFGELDPPLDGG